MAFGRKRQILAGAVALSLAVFLLVAYHFERPAEIHVDRQAGPAATRVDDASGNQAQQQSEPGAPAKEITRLPERDRNVVAASLAGSDPDGEIHFAPDGRLVIDRALRHRFDYLLSAIGEQSLEQLRQSLLASLTGRFSRDQVEQVMAEFDLYAAYLRAVDELFPDRPASLHEQMTALAELQADLLGDQRTEAWFGEENRYIERTLAAMDGDLEPGNPDEDPWAAEIEQATSHHLALEMNRQYQKLDLPADQRHLERSALFGQDAADRLAELDAERAAWQARVVAYADQRQALFDNPALTPAEIEQLLARERELAFNETEQRRILALEKAGLLDEEPGRP
jgi:lipase chaperone LimK